MIPFNIPPYVGTELEYMKEAIENHKISGDGPFTQKCNRWLEERFNLQKVLLTTSGTSALEMAAIMCDLSVGDEVILPSYTFSSTATAFVLTGAKLVFVDIRVDTMNIDENKIESAITDKTKVICVMHYAGIACNMDKILNLAGKYNLMVVEDAAQGIMSTYRGKALGSLGDFGCFSFHETKNYSMGEGGAIIINDEKYNEKAEVLREKGTNRSQYYRGSIAKYNWVDYGSSYLPSDINAAYLWAQLKEADRINADRLKIWNLYYDELKYLEVQKKLCLPVIPNDCANNAHMFYLKCFDVTTRTKYISFMKENSILCVFHYVPLHSSPAGIKYGRFHGEDLFTTAESNKLVRLPLYYSMNDRDMALVIKQTKLFFDNYV